VTVDVLVIVDVLVEVVVVVGVVVDVECVVEVVGVVVDVLVDVDVVVPIFGHRLTSWLCGPGADGPSRTSPSCWLWPFVHPFTLMEITTHGFDDEPVRWQTSTFSPAVDCADADDCCCCFFLCPFLCPCVVEVDDCAPADCVTVACAGLLGCEGCDGCVGCDGFVPTDAEAVELVRFVWPRALADLPCGFACFSVFFWCPGALPEFPGDAGGPWPLPATAVPVNTTRPSAIAIVAPRRLLDRCMVSVLLSRFCLGLGRDAAATPLSNRWIRLGHRTCATPAARRRTCVRAPRRGAS
jgi:hypothetical protein